MKRCETMQIRGCKIKISKVKVENKRESCKHTQNQRVSREVKVRGLERGVLQPWSDTGRESAGQAGLSKGAGVSLKVGTSSTGIVSEPSFIFFVKDRNFCFPTFTSPFLSVALRISGGFLCFLCFYMKNE